MRRVVVSGLLVLAASSFAAVFERFLDPNVPRDRAIVGYLELEKQGKASSNDLAELAVLLVEKGFPQDGEAYLRKALELDKKNVEARYRLALVLQRLGKDRAAAREYRKVIEARPGFAEAQFMLGLALERCGARQAAIRAYAKAYKHNPDLANPAKNPLVLDSRLQAQAQIRRYQRDVASSTLPLQPLDPNAVRQMMLARPPGPKPSPSPVPVPESKGPGSAVPPVPAPPSRTPEAVPAPTPEVTGGPEGSPRAQAPLLPLGNASRPLAPKR